MADAAVKRRTVTAPPSAGSDALLPAQRSRDKPIGRSLTWRRPHQVKENVQLRIEQQLLASLAHFVGIRTVSGDPHLHEDVFAGAKYLAGLLESVGMQVKLAQNVNTVHPCVLARLEVCPNLPTVVFYGHYDVFYVGDDVRLPAPPPPPPPHPHASPFPLSPLLPGLCVRQCPRTSDSAPSATAAHPRCHACFRPHPTAMRLVCRCALPSAVRAFTTGSCPS